MEDNKQKIIEALSYLNPADFDYDGWLRVGMAIHAEGLPMSVFDEWSRKDPARYNEKDLNSTWNSFGKGGGKEVTGGTIIQLAKDRGFDMSRKMSVEAYNWNDTLLPEEDLEIRKPHKLSPVEQLITYLKTVFKENDKVGYVTNDCYYNDEKKKWEPMKGQFDRTAGELIKGLEKHKDQIQYVIGDYQLEAGAWIRFNPLDGKGVSMSNVTAFNYVLVESDTISKAEQLAFYRKWRLPIVAAVDSGSKSIHAITHVDAKDEKEFQERVLKLFDFLDTHGFPIDMSNKNANKLSRMPGVSRNGIMQELIGINMGCKDYEEWEHFINDELSVFSPMNVTEFFHNPELPKPELIHGLLRKGHVLLLAGPSKAGKSFLMIRLAVCLSEGKPFLSFGCEKAKVVYINPEIEASSIGQRFVDVYEALHIDHPSEDNPIDVINLRGQMVDVGTLTRELTKRYANKKVDVIIIDPIYKFMAQDESNAEYVSQFLSTLEKLGNDLNATVIYSHHHTKGPSTGKSVIDRSSGSGIFARQADAIVDLTELDLDEEFREENYFDDSWTAFQMECVTREFRRPKPVKVIFKYPLHEVDEANQLKNCYPIGDIRNAQKKNNKQITIEDRYIRFIDAFFEVTKDGGASASLDEVANRVGLKPKTIRTNVKEFGGFVIKEGIIYKLEAKKA